MAKERPLSIPVILGIKGKGLDEAIKDTKRLSTQLGRLSDTAIKAAAGFVAFKGGQLVANFARDAIDAGRDLQVNLNGLQSVFGDLTPEMVEFTKSTAGIGLSMSEAAKASTFLGSVLKQSGFAMDEVSEQTQRLVKLGADLSLTYGYDVQEALLAMTALFRGEYDPIEKFGVAMKQNEIEGEKLARGLGGLTGSAERLVDQQIRLEFLYDRASDSMGAYERQAGTLRVAQDTLRASFNNMQQILGTQVLPVVADLTNSMIPLVEAIGPILAAAIRQVVPLLVAFAQNTDQIVSFTVGLVKVIAAVVTVMATLAKIIVENINFIKVLVITLGVLATGFYAVRIGVAVFNTVRAAVLALNVTLVSTKVALDTIKIAMFAIPILGWLAALGTIISIGYGISASAKAAGDSVEEMLDTDALLAEIDDVKNSAENAMADVGDAMGETVGGAGNAAKDAVAEFYNKLVDEANKQQAKLRLQQLGASVGLIQSILGAGEDWQRVFNDVVSRGIAGVADVQRLFQATAAGFDEAMSQWEEEYGEPFRKFKEDALAARDALIEFTREIEILPSVAETLGQFERDAVENLASIEEKLEDAFDNGQLLDGSYQALLQYARDEFQVLRQIERQRDDIIGRRNAAEALINSVQSSILSGARLVGILGKVTTEAEGVDVVEFATRTVSAGTSLKEFRTALLYNFVEPIEKAKSRADELVSGYRAVVERTREFVENLKALRALGLDPMLFNQLVEAGVEAGGETAKALVEGGSDTINEINGLFKELDTLGMELGENTAQVMYGQGENFVNGIVAGLEAQAGELELSATSIAEAFTTAFEEVLTRGINAAIDAAQAALARMPKVGDYAPGFDPGPGPGPGPGPTPTEIANRSMTSGTVLSAISEGLRKSPIPISGTVLSAIQGQTPLRGPITNTPSFGPYVPGSGGVPELTRIVNIYTQSSLRETANAQAQLNSKTGSSRTTTSVRALSDFSVG
jgi:hypothetical protein